MPWALLAAATLACGFFALRRRNRGNMLILAGSAAALLWIAIFGNYAYWYFVQNRLSKCCALGMKTAPPGDQPLMIAPMIGRFLAFRWPTAGKWSACSTTRA